MTTDPLRGRARQPSLPPEAQPFAAHVTLSNFDPPPAESASDMSNGEKAGQRKGANGEAKTRAAQLTNGDNLVEERTDRAWQDCIAIRELHLIAGEPEAGKTTCGLSHAAIFSAGARWPDGTKAKARNVIIWTGEDSPERTILPRLLQMGADRKKLWFVKRPKSPSTRRSASGYTAAASAQGRARPT
jgi:hypothetical protein